MFTKAEKDVLGNITEVDITEVYRYDKEAEAEVEAEAVYRYEDGAEVEVWSASKPMYSYWKENLFDNETNVTENNGTIYTTYTAYKGTATEPDYLYVLIDGEFTNPTISFDYFGGTYTGAPVSTYVEAGTLRVVGIDAGGEETTLSIGTVGLDGDFSGGSAKKTLNGTFVSVGIRYFVQIKGYPDAAYTELELSNIIIDDKKYVAN